MAGSRDRQDNGRLIINTRGECVQVFDVDRFDSKIRHVTIQTTVKFDHLVVPVDGWPPASVTSELVLSVHEGKALVLKLADALGLACELKARYGPLARRS